MTHSSSEELIRRRLAVVPRGVGMFAGETTVASAKGAHLTDHDGRDLIDFAAGIGVMNAGHCDERVVRAIQSQAATLLHTCIHVATYEPYVALCEKLAELLPHGASTKVMLVSSGAEAVENAVKIARQATGRPAIFCYDGAFHGRTLLGMSLTGKSAYKKHCGPFAPEIYRRPFPDHFRHGDGLSMDRFVERELKRFEEGFVTGPVPADHVAAVIIEVVQGEGGFVPAPPEYLRGLRRICDDHGILLICDEVQSGFCRTGRWAAYEHAGIVPDLSTWAKSMGGGMPIGAVVGKAEIMDKAEPGTIGGTYGGNPVVCAGALANIEVMEEKDLNRRARTIGNRVRARFESLKAKCDWVADVRGLGGMVAMELCHERDPARPATELVKRATARCREQGVLVITAGPFGNVIRVLSPLVIEDEDLERGLDVIEQAVLASA
ncbi:MAG TPA: aspartate aminotransferase family protein [Vicinamibacteria bacterium]|nr:aspartate aminotransferase family protein [Vicinamibacteria bacterium]